MNDKPDGTYTHHNGVTEEIYVFSSPAELSGESVYRVSVKFPGGALSHGYNHPTKEAAYDRGIQIAEEAIEKEIHRGRS